MKTFITSALFVCLVLTTAFSQAPVKGKINGKVADATGKSLEFVTMMLVKAKDSTLVKGGITDVNGAYEFENIAAGQYRVAAQQMGYAKTFSDAFAVDPEHTAIQLPALQMLEASKSLAEVKVTAKKPFIEQQIDRTVVNVENSIVASGNTALEVLEKAPGVTIDRQSEEISLKGKSGVIVMIDGKQTYLSSQEVANLLKNTPSDNIEKIEIITNPSSKYDAAGNSGIINIKMKKNKNFGTNGTWIGGLGYGRFEKYNTTLNLNHREGKINAFGSYSFNGRRSFNETTINRAIPFDGTITYFDQVSYRPINFQGHNLRGGIDYFINKKSTIGVLATGFMNGFEADGLNHSVLSNENREVTLRPTTNALAKNKWMNLTGNLNYKYDFNGKGRELTADVDYSKYDGEGNNNLTTTYLKADNTTDRPTEYIRNKMPSTIDIWAFKTDYTHPTKKGKFEAGVKSSFVQSDNNMVFENQLDGRWIIDANRTNRFKYLENVNAAYASFSSKLNKKTSIQAGLRLEQTHSRGNSVTLNKVIDRNYVNLFPTLFVSRQLDTNNVLNVSYSRRIDRPNYQDLNPFMFFLDPYTYQVGNPNIKPQMTHSLQLTHTYKGSISTSVGFSRTNDFIMRQVPGQIAEQNIAYITTENLAVRDNANLTLSFPVTVRKWWTMQNNVTAFYNRINTPYRGGQYNVSFVGYNLYSSSNFVLGKGFSGELAAWYNSAGVDGFFRYQPMGAFSVGVQKQVMNKKGTLRVNVNDPFWLNRFRGETKYQDISMKVQSVFESRQARVTFTYRFGNQNVKAARQRRSATADEQGRVQSGN
ncbi:outer membrane beta-barrel family protein [Nibrella saemangeumensis]|uniref:Outer membrane beta-barrel family protein n=1 Tax=Nibrella saemangeumensis TaxID=1084526 RepID=A0ABP8M9G1_9BACT